MQDHFSSMECEPEDQLRNTTDEPSASENTTDKPSEIIATIGDIVQLLQDIHYRTRNLEIQLHDLIRTLETLEESNQKLHDRIRTLETLEESNQKLHDRIRTLETREESS
jgi:DNA repair exonuclease SbcCD ATPase subunit